MRRGVNGDDVAHDQPSLLGWLTPEWIAHTWNELMPPPIAKDSETVKAIIQRRWWTVRSVLRG